MERRGRYGVTTVDRVRDLAKIKLGEVAADENLVHAARDARKGLCDMQRLEVPI